MSFKIFAAPSPVTSRERACPELAEGLGEGSAHSREATPFAPVRVLLQRATREQLCHPDEASNASPVCHPDEASNASPVCHPDEASNASGRKDLGQLRDPRSRFRFLIQRAFPARDSRFRSDKRMAAN